MHSELRMKRMTYRFIFFYYLVNNKDKLCIMCFMRNLDRIMMQVNYYCLLPSCMDGRSRFDFCIHFFCFDQSIFLVRVLSPIISTSCKANECWVMSTILVIYRMLNKNKLIHGDTRCVGPERSLTLTLSEV